MDYLQLWPGPAWTLISSAFLLLLCAATLLVWLAGKVWNVFTFRGQGELILEKEIHGKAVDYIGLLAAEDRNRKPRYEWKLSTIDREDFPYTQMTDLPFTHITVTQKKQERDLVTISVIERTPGLRHADFYWIRDATIGNRPGFPRALLLPHNFVLKIVNSETAQ